MRYLARTLALGTLLSLGFAWALSVVESEPRPPEERREEAADSYTIERGDTLWKIATRYIQDDAISSQQIMLALLHANPDAFVDNNINNLKTGHVLRLPAREEILATGFEDAVAEVAAHNTLWREYQARLTGTTPVVLEEVATVSRPVAAGEPTSPTILEAEDERVKAAPIVQPVPVSDARLEQLADGTYAEDVVAITAADDKDMTTLQHELALALEQATSRGSANEELRARVAALETMLAKQDESITTQNAQLLELQQRRAVAWPADPKVLLTAGGVALLLLAWLRRMVRRATANKATAETTAVALLEPKKAYVESEEGLLREDRIISDDAQEAVDAAEAAADAGMQEETTLNLRLEPEDVASFETEATKKPRETVADLLLDLDDLELDLEQRGE